MITFKTQLNMFNTFPKLHKTQVSWQVEAMQISVVELVRDSWLCATVKFVGSLQASESDLTKKKKPTTSFFYYHVSKNNEVKTTGQF